MSMVEVGCLTSCDLIFQHSAVLGRDRRRSCWRNGQWA